MPRDDLRLLYQDGSGEPSGSSPKSPEEVARALQALSDRLREFRRERDWEQFHTPRNLAISISIEAGELLEQFQWLSDDDVDHHVAANLDGIGEEIADVVIYAIQLSDVVGVSLGNAIESKLGRNAERYPASVARGSSAKYDALPPVIKAKSSRR